MNFTNTSCDATLEDVGWRARGAVLTTYGALMFVGAAGNVGVLVALLARRRRSRVDLLMKHLAVADVCVTCGVIPLEMGWKWTNAWLAGNLLCKLLLVLRAFGLYLSSNVLVCISVDRFLAVLYPLKLSVARRRSRQMLCGAWAAALACSLPQSAVFRVLRHPRVPGFEQCVSFGAFPSARLELAYNVFCLAAMYFLPLLVITACYLCIFCEIRRSSDMHEQWVPHTRRVRLRRPDCGVLRCTERGVLQRPDRSVLRRSDRSVLERARRRTLRMTVTIVTVFALCWLPYATMAMWYMVDRGSAARVPAQVQDLLFAAAVSNSCMNPLVYGSYALRPHRAARRCLAHACCRAQPDAAGNPRSSPTRNHPNNGDLALVTVGPDGRTRPRLVRFAETVTATATTAPEPVRRAPA